MDRSGANPDTPHGEAQQGPAARLRARLSRRTLLAGGAAAGAGVIAAATGITTWLRDGSPGANGSSPSPSPTVPPTKTPVHPGLSAVREDPSSWHRSRLSTGETIDLEHGVCFIDTAAGQLDAMGIAGVSAGLVYGGIYQVSADAQLVAVQVDDGAGQEAVGGLLDRAADRRFAWDGSLLRLQLLDSRLLVFGGLAGDPTYGADAYPGGNRYASGQFFLADREMHEIGRFTLGPNISDAAYQVALSDDATRLLMIAPSSVRPAIVDTSNARVLEAEQPEFEGFVFVESVAPGKEAGSVMAVYRDDQSKATAVTWAMDASVLSQEPIEPGSAAAPGLVSPDGSFRSVPGTLRDHSWGLGDQDNWVYSDFVEEATGETRFRVLSGWTGYGLGGLRRWLADSSGYLVEAADAAAPLDGYETWRTHRAHYLVSRDGTIEKLPPIPGELAGARDDPRSNWSYYAYFGGPEPSPDDAALLVFGRMAVHDRRTGAWFGPGRCPWPHEGDDPWAFGSGEAFFSFPNLGKDYASPGTILPPMVERAPFRTAVTLQVARAGDCLNLRNEPASTAEVLDCMPDGTRLTVGDSRYLLDRGWQFVNGPPAFWSDDLSEPRQMYVFVETATGADGWCAIQYLDWAEGGGP